MKLDSWKKNITLKSHLNKYWSYSDEVDDEVDDVRLIGCPARFASFAALYIIIMHSKYLQMLLL